MSEPGANEIVMPMTERKLQLAAALVETLQPVMEAAAEVALTGVLKAMRFATAHNRQDQWASFVEAPVMKLCWAMDALDPGFAETAFGQSIEILAAERVAAAPAKVEETAEEAEPPAAADAMAGTPEDLPSPEGAKGNDSEGGKGDAER